MHKRQGQKTTPFTAIFDQKQANNLPPPFFFRILLISLPLDFQAYFFLFYTAYLVHFVHFDKRQDNNA